MTRGDADTHRSLHQPQCEALPSPGKGTAARRSCPARTDRTIHQAGSASTFSYATWLGLDLAWVTRRDGACRVCAAMNGLRVGAGERFQVLRGPGMPRQAWAGFTGAAAGAPVVPVPPPGAVSASTAGAVVNWRVADGTEQLRMVSWGVRLQGGITSSARYVTCFTSIRVARCARTP